MVPNRATHHEYTSVNIIVDCISTIFCALTVMFSLPVGDGVMFKSCSNIMMTNDQCLLLHLGVSNFKLGHMSSEYLVSSFPISTKSKLVPKTHPNPRLMKALNVFKKPSEATQSVKIKI